MKWYNIVNKSDKAEIWIYEEIGESFWNDDGISAKSFQKELSGIKASQIDLHINSPGGLVFEGIAIYNLLKQYPANITTYIDGLAASIASVIALAGNKVIMAENGLFMIHKASGIVMGTSDDMRDFADKLDKINGSIITTYISKTKKDESEINNLMAAETWMNAKEALEMGFIDEISGEADMSACAKFISVMQKAKFKHIPENIADKKLNFTARNLEHILRGAGVSQKQAKAILAGGYKEDQWDVDLPINVQRDAEIKITIPPISAQRDVEQSQLKKNGKVAELLTRGELLLNA